MEQFEYYLSNGKHLKLWHLKNWWFFSGIIVLMILAAVDVLYFVLFKKLELTFFLFFLITILLCLQLILFFAARVGGNRIYGNVRVIKQDDGRIKFESEYKGNMIGKTMNPKRISNFHSAILVYESWRNYLFVPKEAESKLKEMLSDKGGIIGSM